VPRRGCAHGAWGRLRHARRCHELHLAPPALRDLVLPEETCNLEITYCEPPYPPVARCVEPYLSVAGYPFHPHFYAPDVICPIFPSDDTWRWPRDTAADFAFHVVIWLVKSAIWRALRLLGRQPVWIGAQVGHDPTTLAALPPRALCYCGSGREFRVCHRNQVLRLKHATPFIVDRRRQAKAKLLRGEPVWIDALS
jgi:hypothetical protein